jgi:hypothetical protein
MGPRPQGLTLERKNNYLGYEPSNCVWATRAEQAHNTTANKLTATDVERIRDIRRVSNSSWRVLGRYFGVSKTMIGYILRGKQWKA